MNRSMLESVFHRVAPEAAARASDTELLQRFAADRDECAFTALVRRHGPLVWAACRGLLAVEADAEDAFQATFLALARSPKSVRHPAALPAWLHGVACRAALKARREAARRKRRERATAAAEMADPVAESVWNRLRAAVHEEVCRLPEALRTAFVLCELEGVGQREAAAALGWKPGTLTGRLTRARQQLLERLSRRDVSAGAVVAAVAASGAATAAPVAIAVKAAELARIGSDLTDMVSANILELAQAATEVSMTRTRLAAAAAIIAALAIGTATTLLPLATAQRPAEKQPPANNPFLPPRAAAPADVSFTAAGQWEYKFVPRQGDSLEAFEQLLGRMGTLGWEYAGTESLKPTDLGNLKMWNGNPTVVFKRPRTNADSAGSDTGMSPRPASRNKDTQDAGTSPSVKGAPNQNMFAMRLSHAKAARLATTLQELFTGRNCRFIADERTNTLLVQADESTLMAIQAVIEKIDIPAPGESAKP